MPGFGVRTGMMPVFIQIHQTAIPCKTPVSESVSCAAVPGTINPSVVARPSAARINRRKAPPITAFAFPSARTDSAVDFSVTHRAVLFTSFHAASQFGALDCRETLLIRLAQG